MRAIVCEMCGGRELLKQDDVYICQSCGTRYAPEEAKKLVITVDNSESVKNGIQNGRRAWESRDWPEAERYYNLAEQYDPQNSEAVFFSAFARFRKVYDALDWGACAQELEVLTKTAAVLAQNRDVDVAERVADSLLALFAVDPAESLMPSLTVTQLATMHIKASKMMDQLADAVADAVLNDGMDNTVTLRLCQRMGEALADAKWAIFEVRKKWLAKCDTYAAKLTSLNAVVVGQDYQEKLKCVKAEEKGYGALGCFLILLGAAVVLILLHSIFGS